MKMTVTLRQLSPLIESLNKFVQVPIPVKYSWRLGKVMKKLQAEIEEFSISRNDLYVKYGDEVEGAEEGQPGVGGGKKYKVPNENMEVFISEMNDLLEETVEIEFEPVPLSIVEDSSISIADMANLEAFFIDEN